MLKFNGIDHVNMNVYDLKKTIEFYKELLDFEVFEREDYEDGRKYALLGKSGVGTFALYETGDRSINHIGINVSNFEEVKDIAKKYEDPRYPGLTKYEGSSSYYILDPNGYSIEISQIKEGGN